MSFKIATSLYTGAWVLALAELLFVLSAFFVYHMEQTLDTEGREPLRFATILESVVINIFFASTCVVCMYWSASEASSFWKLLWKTSSIVAALSGVLSVFLTTFHVWEYCKQQPAAPST